MKKILAIIMVAAMALSIAACTDNSTNSTVSDSGTSSSVSTTSDAGSSTADVDSSSDVSSAA